MDGSSSHIDELLQLYLDRELSAEQEEQVYARLANDELLRSDLKQFQTLQAETRHYLSMLTPPASTTNGVFSSLGFSGLTSAGNTARNAAKVTAAMQSTVGSAGSGFSTLKQLWAPVLSACFSAVVTSVILFSIYHNQNAVDAPVAPAQTVLSAPSVTPVVPPAPAEEQSRNASASAATATVSVPDMHRSSNSTSSDATNSRNASSASEAHAEPVHIAADNTDDDMNDDIDQRGSNNWLAARPGSSSSNTGYSGNTRRSHETLREPLVPASNRTTDVSQVEIQPVQRYDVPVEATVSQPEQIEDRAALRVDVSQKPALSLFVRGMDASSYPEPSHDAIPIGTRTKSNFDKAFDNVAAGVYYKLSEHHYLGIEVGQEAFSQSYNGIYEGLDRNIYQNTLAMWATINYRYHFDGLFHQQYVRPFLAVGAGWTQHAWPLGRASAGVSIAPASWIEFLVGVEGGLLAFPYQSTWFTSKKYGALYGIFINF